MYMVRTRWWWWWRVAVVVVVVVRVELKRIVTSSHVKSDGEQMDREGANECARGSKGNEAAGRGGTLPHGVDEQRLLPFVRATGKLHD